MIIYIQIFLTVNIAALNTFSMFLLDIWRKLGRVCIWKWKC